MYKEKGSKFLCFIHHVENADAVKEIVDVVKKRFFDARHVCYAYRIGKDGLNFRAVDDGEPSSTAGKPILGQLLSAEITDTLAIVVRYFGGTKLGVSGLINAYKCATKDAIENGVIVEKIVEISYFLSFYFSQTDAVMKNLRKIDANIIEQNYDNNTTLKVNIRQSAKEIFENTMSKIEGVQIEQL